MALRTLAALAAAATVIIAPAVSHAAGFTMTDDHNTLTFAAWASDNGDQVSINGGDYVGGAGGVVSAASSFTFAYTGFGVGLYDSAPLTDYFVDDSNNVVARFTWTNTPAQSIEGWSTDTGVFDDFLAEGVAAPTLPVGVTGININPAGATVGFGYYGFGGAITVSAVPEPASMALLGAGLAGMGVLRRRRAA